MKLTTNWHSTWTPWVEYHDRQTGAQYRSRHRQLFCGRTLIATLVHSTKRPKSPFYMYSNTPGLGVWADTAVFGPTAFRTVRRFIREKLT